MAQTDLFKFPKRPWNVGLIVGPKAPLKPKHIWAIRQQLKMAARIRDLALFNCAIDAKLRGCDLVKLRVSDVAPSGSVRLRSTVIQQDRPASSVRNHGRDPRSAGGLAGAPREQAR
jgi:hypothetical protein